MPAKKKASAVDNLNARLSLVVKSGKISLGHRTTVKALRKSQGECRGGEGERWRLGVRIRGNGGVVWRRWFGARRLTCALAVWCLCLWLQPSSC